jgi:Xaa-Pro dipeptidase
MHFEISHDEHRDRYRRLQAAMADAGIDTLLSWAPENVYYMTGYDTLGYYFPQCLIASVDSDPALVVRHFESPNVEAQTWVTNYVGYLDHEDVAEIVAQVAAKFGTRIGTESQTWAVSPAIAARVADRLDGRVVPLDGLVEALRLVKSSAEIGLIRQSCRYTEAAMTAAFEASVPGATEDDVAATVYHRMISAGSTYPSLAQFVSSGPRTFMPHQTWSGRVLQPGDMLWFETGGSAGRYGSGLIRIGAVDEPPAENRAVIERALGVVTETLEALMAAIRPGTTGAQVHQVGRAAIKAAGWGDVHRNRSGYSIGVSYPPDWGEGHIYSLQDLETRPLEAGMVFHLVPNVLIPDVAGVAISETVLITPDGCEALTQFPREFMQYPRTT